MTVSTADLYDELGDELQSVPLQFQTIGGRTRFSGPIRTVTCFEDNALLKSILSTRGDGAVLVVDGGGSLNSALMGDMIADLAVANGWSGAIINGAVRDRVAIGALHLGVKALGSNPRKSSKTGSGVADAVVEFAGVVFTPGRSVYCDEDGILVER